jgi:hypothetical protein
MDPFITKQVLSLTTAVLTQILTADITTIPAAKTIIITKVNQMTRRNVDEKSRLALLCDKRKKENLGLVLQQLKLSNYIL